MLTAVAAAALVRAGGASSVELVEDALRRIAATDAELGAWEVVDGEGALRSARRVDDARRGGVTPGALAGVPLGVKDIFDVAGLPTMAGFAPYATRVATHDAEVVASLRREGAIVVGKTVTAQFAFTDPPRTRHPLDPARTPGGSSSGSAVAVAARHVPVALASQTGGSTLRPAAYTGCVGLKPSFGLVSTEGMIPLARSLDHVGFIATSVDDCRLLLSAAVPAPMAAPVPVDRPRLGVVVSGLEAASVDVRTEVERAIATCAGAGARAADVVLDVALDQLWAAHRVILRTEAAGVHTELFRRHPEEYQPRMRALVEEGQRVPAAAYEEAQRVRRRARQELARAAASVDALVLPTTSALPGGRESTGESLLQAVFSSTGLPSITIPLSPSAEGLPHALQLAAAPGADMHLLDVAAWCADALRPAPPHRPQ